MKTLTKVVKMEDKMGVVQMTQLYLNVQKVPVKPIAELLAMARTIIHFARDQR